MVEVPVRETDSFESNDGEEKDFHQQEDDSYKIRFLEHIRAREVELADETLVEYVHNHFKIYTTKDDDKSEMWVYQEGIYIPQGRSEVKELLRKLLGSSYSMYYASRTIAKIETDTYINVQEFFDNNYVFLVPVKNGILNIRTRELTPFNPDMIFFNKLPVKYDEEATCPQIDNFLQQVLSDKEDVDVIYELGGFSLMNEYTFEKAFIFVGNGRNGKDKTLELFKRLIGVENCSAVSLNQLQPDSSSISYLLHKKINLAGEISSKNFKDSSMFKAVTGRSLIGCKRKYKTDLVFENYSKMVFACNELPMIYDDTKGFWDRWVLLEFPYMFVPRIEYEKAEDKSMLKIRDEDIINKITTQEELSGLLNKFLDGLDKLLENKTFSSTRGTDEVKNVWIRKSNSFMAFCLDNIEEDYQGRIIKKDMRKRYSKYCKAHRVNSKSDIVIKNTLQQMYGASEERKMLLGNVEQEHIWEGIKWK